jgi:predicted Ser/Thr protein kinase
MGTVYRALDPILDRQVALKTVAHGLISSPETRERFQREARAAARLQHPNIVTIYELGEVEGTLFIAMELLEGRDLTQLMSDPKGLSLERKLEIMTDVCRGLDFAHKRGVVHRDVKPANIRILNDGTVKLVDFGIARMVDTSNMTQTGIVLGTPSYIAPEMLVEGKADHRADIWAVGVILYEMLAGRRPYDGATIAGLVYRIVHEPLPPLPQALGLPPELTAIVARALSKDPDGRFKDLAEMAHALQAVLGGTGDAPLAPEARRKAYEENFAEARQLLVESDLEGALQAARRAQALEPSRTSIVDLVGAIEQQLRGAPTIRRAAPVLPDFGATLRTPAPDAGIREEPLPTPVLTTLRLHGAAVFRELATFGEPPATQTASLSPVKDLLATSGSDGALRIWDLHSRTRLRVLRSKMHLRTGHEALALSLAWSPDGTLLASGHVDGSVHLWDLETGQELAVSMRHDALVGAVAFSPDGRTLATGGMDSSLKLWDVRAAMAGEARREMLRQPSGITALSYAGEGAWLITGHANRVLRVHDARTSRLMATLRGPEGAISLLCAAPDGRRLAVVSQDRAIRLYDLVSRSELFVMSGHKKPAAGLSFFPDGMHLATVALDNAVQLWDLDSRSSLAALWGPSDESFAGVALFAGGDHIAVALSDGRIRLWGPAA